MTDECVGDCDVLNHVLIIVLFPYYNLYVIDILFSSQQIIKEKTDSHTDWIDSCLEVLFCDISASAGFILTHLISFLLFQSGFFYGKLSDEDLSVHTLVFLVYLS